MTIKELMLQHQLVAIIRGLKAEDLPAVVDALYKGGILIVEITLNTEGALQMIQQTIARNKGRMLIGAGTVLNPKAALEAIDAGAQFIISPSFDTETIAVTKAKDIVSIPGAYTATEIVKAHEAGADIIKVFPASSPQYIKDLRGPLSHIPLMPTGGVQLENIHAFKEAGAIAFGIGSALVNSKVPVTTAYLETLAENARLFVQAIH